LPDVREWSDRSLVRFRELQSERSPDDQRFSNGFWTFAYQIESFPRIDLLGLLETLTEIQGHDTGWPPWWVPTRSEIRPYPYTGVIECWLGESTSAPSDSDFWRASPNGELFLLRGYQDDDPGLVSDGPGQVMDPLLPIWRVGECLRHASSLARRAAAPEANVHVLVRWTGLAGRRMHEWANRAYSYHFDEGPAHQHDAEALFVTTATRIDTALSAVVKEATTPLFNAFGFGLPDDNMYNTEIERLTDKSKRPW